MNYYYLLIFLFFVLISYIFTKFVFDLLLRGFIPFICSRPWVVEQILAEFELKKEDPVIIGLSCGRSGFFNELGKKYPKAKLIGIEPSFFPYLVAKVQVLIRFSSIKVYYKKIRHIDVSQADFIYSHLYPDKMEDLGTKLKFECQAGTKIISTGFNIKDLNPYKIIDLPDRKGKWDFLSRNQNIFQKSSSKFKKEKKAYFYEI